MTTTLSELNTCAPTDFIDRLRGIYEHSPWIPERAATQRPFATLAALNRLCKPW
jgi:N-carbamoyl-L-amino-acid hydrolase